MAKAKRGDKVRLHYTGRLADGRVFDSTEHAGNEEWQNFRGTGVAFAPMELVIGGGEMPPAFEEALVGLEPGQRVSIEIPSAEAFGPRREACLARLPRAELVPSQHHLQTFRVAEGRQRPNKFEPKLGDSLEVTNPDGTVVSARVAAMDAETVTLDANHPLAGQDLFFDVHLLAIV